MEPSGRNRWQPVANGSTPKTAQTGRSTTGGNPRQPFRSAWEGGGVDGSSPSEGLQGAPGIGVFALRSTYRVCLMRWGWIRLWILHARTLELPLTALSLKGCPDEPTCSGTTASSGADAPLSFDQAFCLAAVCFAEVRAREIAIASASGRRAMRPLRAATT